MLETVRVPVEFEALFDKAQEYVREYHAQRREEPKQGTIEIHGQRYIRVRAASMSVEFFDLVKSLYSGEREAEAEAVARSLLYDIAHALGLADARDFHEQMGVTDPVERLSAGPVHFAYSGWAFVDIHPDSNPTPDETFCLRYDHPYSFESDAWTRAGRESHAPVCVMNAGYSSGWCEASFDIPLVAAELLCTGRGDECCRFIMAPPEQIEFRIAEFLALHPDAAEAVGDVHIPGFFRERRRAEAALHESEQRFRGAFDHATIGMALVATTGELTLVNEALASMVGVSGAELVGKLVADLAPASRTANMAERLRRLVDGEVTSVRFDTDAVHRDGHLVPVLITAALVRDKHGTPSHIVAQAQDLTEQRNAEAELRRRDEQLQRAQRLDAIGRLAGGMAHDFNNALTVIMGYAEQLAISVEGHSGQAAARSIVDAADRASLLTQQLLAFSRKQVLQPRLLDPAHTLAGVQDMLQRLVSEDIDVRYESAPGIWPVHVDPTQFEQAFVNLAVNARDAMPEGGSLRIELKNVELSSDEGATLRIAPGKYVQTTVQDDGLGMDDETLAHLFEPFYTTKFDGEGIGLGMATVYGFVQQSGGAVTVESSLGQGATFRLYLPAAEGVPERRISNPPSRIAGGTATILLIEDNEDIRELLGESLAGLGYNCISAENGLVAVDRAQANEGHIDLILTDVVMPEMSGPNAVAAIQAMRTNIRVLYMTGYADSRRGRRGLPTDAVVMNKPFTIASMRRQIEKALRGRTSS